MKSKIYPVYLVIVTLVLAEIFTRIFVPDKVIAFVPSKNPSLVYELNPKYPGINSSGMRGAEIDFAKLPEQFVIAAIGDSHTYSTLAADSSQSYPAQLEEQLNLAGNTTPPCRVLNFGVPGYNTAVELELLKAKVLPLRPNLIILQNTVNDTHVCNYLNPQYPVLNSLIHSSAALVRTWKNILYSKFGDKYLYEFIGKKMPDLLLYRKGLVGTMKSPPGEVPEYREHPPGTPDRVPARYHYMLGEENWKKHVAEFADAAKKKGIPILATGFIRDTERNQLQQAGFSVYSFEEMFEGLNTLDYGNYDKQTYTSGHFNEQGCKIIAEKLAGYIKAHFPLEPKAQASHSD